MSALFPKTVFGLAVIFTICWPSSFSSGSIASGREVDFENDLVPVFTKLGCNAGACHGSAAGRGGLRLSLYGSNPVADYAALALELEGRRINLAAPERSLLLRKPSEELAHGGGMLIETADPAHQLLQQWIAQGARFVPGRKLKELEVNPSQVIAKVGEAVSLSVSARYDDNSSRGVTEWTVLSPEDGTAVSVGANTGKLHVHRPGRHLVVVRYLNQVVPLEILVPVGDSSSDLVAATIDDARSNFIDQEIDAALNRLGIPASGDVGDEGFLRRVSLHLTGRLPKYASQAMPLDRAAVVDQLLESEEFIEYWSLQLAKLLRLRGQPNDTVGINKYSAWLTEQLRAGTGYDVMARELLTAVGDSHSHGPANFYRTTADPRLQAELVSEIFMGTRLRCANCHDHPLDRWTQDDYHGLAAIFAKVVAGRVIEINAAGEVIHPATQEAARPRIPGLGSLQIPQGDLRPELAQWLTAPENPYFAKAIVNRLWKHLMGRGLVEPVDDFRATNPATHPQLLNELAAEFVASGYNLRYALRTIINSRAYARSSQSHGRNRADDRFYSHATHVELEPEVLADAIADVSGLSETYGDLPVGTRAVALIDPDTPSTALDILGRCDRKDSCESQAGATGGLPQMLHLLNGELLNGRLSASGSRLQQLLARGTQPLEIIRDFYGAALGRAPTPDEVEFWQVQLTTASQEAAAHNKSTAEQELLEDFVWSLLTCEEFRTNH